MIAADSLAASSLRREPLRRGRRGTWIGTAVGVVIVVLLLVLAIVVFGIADPRPVRSLRDFVPTAVELTMLIVMAAGPGRMLASLRATQVLRDAAGERTVAARVRKIVFEDQAALNEHEHARALAYAPLAGIDPRNQALNSATFFLAITVESIVRAAAGPSDAPGLHATQWIVAIGLMITAAMTTPLQARHFRQAANHPDHPRPAVL